MHKHPLLKLERPWLHRLVATESQLCDLNLQLVQITKPRVVSRVVRGHKCRSTQALFDEFAAALQFPYYFGENWNAFDECLADLEWLPGEAYVVLLANAAVVAHVVSVQKPRRSHGINGLPGASNANIAPANNPNAPATPASNPSSNLFK